MALGCTISENWSEGQLKLSREGNKTVFLYSQMKLFDEANELGNKQFCNDYF